MIKRQYTKPTLNVVRISNSISLMVNSPYGTGFMGDASDDMEAI